MARIYQPTFVIGLGGTGKKIILALKKMIAETSPHGLADFPFLELLSLDTDKAVPSVSSLIKTIKADSLSLNPNQEVFQLRAGFGTAPDFNDFPEVKDWFPDSLVRLLSSAELSKGAGQKKAIGRFTFAWNANELYERLNSFMRAPVDAAIAKDRNVAEKLSDTINVFICGSICGGTGAGTFLDTAYLVRHIEHENQGNGYQVKIFGMFALASLFDGYQGVANVRQNCYASLVELDHFMNPVNNGNPHRVFHPAYKHFSKDYATSLFRKPPFDYPFFFDNFGKGLALNSQSAFTEMTARFIYLLTGHELSDHWFSMDSNVRANLDSAYKKEVYNKSIYYNSMGTFSVFYPKRMIIQLCAYNLCQDLLSKILDDSYAPQEIDNLVKIFLSDIRLNPTTDQLNTAFDTFNDLNNFAGTFTDYVEQQIADVEAQEMAKNDICENIKVWKKDIDSKINEFKNLNTGKSEQLRTRFLAELEKKLKQLLDLHESKLGVKKDSDGNDLADRGSLVRARKFTEALIELFSEYKDRFRRERDETDALVKNSEADYNEALNDLGETAQGFFVTPGKLKEAKLRVLNICRDLFNAKKNNIICDWKSQLFTGILWNEIQKYPGLIEEVEKYHDQYLKAQVLFTDIEKEITKFLADNKRFEPNPFFDVIFNYEQDVVAGYKNLLRDKSEEFIYGEISNELTGDDKFGPLYLNVAKKTAALVNIDLLNVTEKLFVEPIEKVNISERILQTKEICDRLESGQYYKMANIYLGLETSVLDKIKLNFDNSRFFAISIPDVYQGKPCVHIKGVEASGKICPMDENPEKYQGDSCPLYNRCIKQKLLKNAPHNVSITPTAEISEINVMHTIAGFPLCAISSVMNNCKPAYHEQKRKQQHENNENNTAYEEINMFGSLQFDDLDQPTIDPQSRLKDFKKLLIIAAIAKRLQVETLSFGFFTESDIILKRMKPGLHLGDTFDEVLGKFQSSRLHDIEDIKLFEKEMNHLLAIHSKDAEVKAKIKQAAMDFDFPDWLLDDDRILVNEVTQELCGFTRFEEKILADTELVR